MPDQNVFIRATVPDQLLKEWVQHLRDFDIAHEGCHFEIMIDGPDMPIMRMIETLQVNPGFKFADLWLRKQDKQ
jgi:hypothetical protein